ncbi:hypothetical protein JOQ06_030353, partial [Pogonophryne albipinna]
CNNDYAPVCGSNNQNYQNECFLRRDACKQQSEVLIMSEGACPADAGSGSGDDGEDGSAETAQKEMSTCDICQFGAECDVDAEDVWNTSFVNPALCVAFCKVKSMLLLCQIECAKTQFAQDYYARSNVLTECKLCVCNIDCSHISFNQVCASDGRSYDNPCQVKEASCQKQERIEVKHLGRCQGDILGGDGHFARTDTTVVKEKDPRNGLAIGLYIPCPDHFKNYCVHGECQFPSIVAQPSC